METSINRRDIGYTIISRLEENLRQLVGDKISVLFGDFREAIPPGIIEKTDDRAKSKIDDVLDFLEHTDFPDLKEIAVYKGLYRYYFEHQALSQSEFMKIMTHLYKIRCKIAHVKGIFESMDLDDLFENSREIANAMEDAGTDLLNFLENLENNPKEHAISVPEDFICQPSISQESAIPNNVPMPDYELEGGFVGREEDIRKTVSLVEGDLHRVITLTGAGGVGKTALALRVIQRILKKAESPFDGIVWLSAKETQLSTFGIEEIEPTLKNYEELLDTILDVMGYGSSDQPLDQKEKDVNTIFDIQKRVFIVIDNLETITDDRIIDFILDAHPNVKILVTSRRGLGQVERRYELNQLKLKEAVVLFRQISLEKNLSSLARLDDKTIGRYVSKIACYPLAIKWVIGHVALGKDINTIIDAATQEKSDIALFCFDQIYNFLSSTSQKLLCTLSLFDIPPQAGVLQYVTNLGQEEFEESIRELVLVSFVIPEQQKFKETQIITRFNLLSLTRGFVKKQLDHDSQLKKELEDRVRTVQTTVEEAERAKKQYRFSLFNLGATSEEEKIAALLAQTAYQKYQGGRYAEAVDDYNKASEIAPRFASVYRNWAVMESNEGHSIEADKLMKKAVDLTPKDAQLWLTWGNMKRKEDKIKEALQYYLRAREIAPSDPFILNPLGQAKSRLGDYEEADRLFRAALLEDSDSTTHTISVKHEIVNKTSLADNLGRWAESLSKDRNYSQAKEKLEQALEHCEKAITLDESDLRTKDLLRKLQFQKGHFLKRTSSDLAIKQFKKNINPNPIRFKEARDSVRAAREVIKIYLRENNLEAAMSLFTRDLAKIAKRTDLEAYKEITEMLNELKREGAIEGTIISVNPEKGFTIIESTNSPGDTYLGHVNSFIPRTLELDEDYLNKQVSFYPEVDTTMNRKRARSIKIIHL